MATVTKNSGSFRDPAGFVFTIGGTVYRQINRAGQADYDHFMKSGLYDALAKAGLLVAHKDVNKLAGLNADKNRYTVIQPEAIPFISYPYEWSFDQLRAAALLTLRIQKLSLEHGMILKDASAYNIQFIGNKPIFIDTLSFAIYKPGQAWEAYKQFCEHFVGPLALAHYATPDLLKMQRVYLDGFPLGVTASLLPRRAKLKAGLLSHIYMHRKSSLRHQGNQVANSTASPRKVSNFALQGIIGSLESTVRKMRPPTRKTEWGDYYSFTNYSDTAFKEKRAVIHELLDSVSPKPKMVWDVGANNGEFSELAAEMGAYTVAFDIDEIAVTRNYRGGDKPRKPEVANKLLPLVQDLTNPSPGLGWNAEERSSLKDRGPADAVFALAIIHHLCIGKNIPFAELAEFFGSVAKHLIIEFVPKEDSKVQILLSSRTDIFSEYDAEHFEKAMAAHFKIVQKVPIKDSKRTMYLLKNINLTGK
jgi:ribosomal protein L11 methylase PrmA